MYGYNWTFNIIYCNTCQLVSVNLPTPHWAEKSLLILMYCKNLYGYMKVPQLSDVFMIHSVWKLKQESCLRGLVTQFDEGGSQSSHCPVSIKNTPATCHIFTHRSPLTPQPAWWMWPKIQYTLMLSPLHTGLGVFDHGDPVFSSRTKPSWCSLKELSKKTIFCHGNFNHSSRRSFLSLIPHTRITEQRFGLL